MADNIFKVLIDAVDRFSEPIEKMHKKVVAFQAPIGELHERLSNLGEVSGIERIGEKFGELRESIAGAGEKLVEFLGPLAALGGLASLAGLGEIAIKTGEIAEQLERASKKIGIGVEDLQRLQFAAKATEVPADALETGLSRLNRVIAEAASGKNKDAASMFAHLHIALRDAHGRIKDAADVFPSLSDAMVKNQDQAIRTRIAMTAMGRGGADLLPMMLGGSAALRKFGEDAENVGLLSDEQVASAGKLGEAFKMLRLTVEGISNAIGARLSPVLTPLIEHLTSWLQKNREIIATHIEHIVERLATAIESVDWVAFLTGIEHAIDSVSTFASRNLGLNGTLIALAAFLGAPLLSAFTNVAKAIAGIAVEAVPIALGGFSLLAEGAAGAALKVGLAFEGLSGLAAGMPLVSAALAGVSGAFVGLGAAIEATPVGWILTAVVALGVAGYELYEHWTTVKTFFEHVWANSGLLRTAAMLTPIYWLIRAGAELVDHWTQVKAWFGEVGHWLAQPFKDAWAEIEPFLTRLENNPFVKAGLHLVAQTVAPAATAIADNSSAIASGATDAFQAFKQFVWEGRPTEDPELLADSHDRVAKMIKQMSDATASLDQAGALDGLHAGAEAASRALDKLGDVKLPAHMMGQPGTEHQKRTAAFFDGLRANMNRAAASLDQSGSLDGLHAMVKSASGALGRIDPLSRRAVDFAQASGADGMDGMAAGGPSARMLRGGAPSSIESGLAEILEDLRRLLSGGRLGEIDVNFKDVPPGVRVQTRQTEKVDLSTNVGYNMRPFMLGQR